MKAFLNFLDKLSNIGFWASAIGIVIVTLLIAVDVALRWFGHPILGSYEITELLMSIIIFASFAYTQRMKGHIHVTMFITHMNKRIRFILFGLTSLIGTAVIAYISYAAFTQGNALVKSGQTTAVLGIPLYPFYFIEGIAMVLFTLVLLVDTVRAIMAIYSEEAAHSIQKYWV